MIMNSGRTPKANEEGSILVLTLLITLLLVTAGLAAMRMAATTTKVAGNYNRQTEAYGAAETGLQRGMAVLRAISDWQSLVSGSTCVATKDDPDQKGNILCSNGAPLENFNVVGTGTATAGMVSSTTNNIRYTIWVRNDPAEYAWCNGTLDVGEASDDGDCNADGSNNAADELIRQTDNDGRVILRVEGIARDGMSVAAVAAVVSRGGGSTMPNNYTQAGLNSQGSNSQKGVSIAAP
jgi:Tfp pilus assembly protein PilX